jgi:hypothetical protein
MSEEDWDKLFALIARVVHQKNMTAAQKAQLLLGKISDYGAEIDCCEFAAMVIVD